MIRLGRPYIDSTGSVTRLVSHVVDEKAGLEGDCHFSAEQEYGKFLGPPMVIAANKVIWRHQLIIDKLTRKEP